MLVCIIHLVDFPRTTGDAMKPLITLLCVFALNACAHRVVTTPSPAHVPAPDALACFTGMFIVSDDGRIEAQGCPEYIEIYSPMMLGNMDHEDSDVMVGYSRFPVEHPQPSLLLSGPDLKGRYYFPHQEQEEIPYFKVEDGELVFYMEVEGRLLDMPLYPAYEVNSVVRHDRKLTPFISPDVFGPPLVEMTVAQGQLVKGRPFSLLNIGEQAEMLIYISSEQ